jgi:hypothetical protein
MFHDRKLLSYLSLDEAMKHGDWKELQPSIYTKQFLLSWICPGCNDKIMYADRNSLWDFPFNKVEYSYCSCNTYFKIESGDIVSYV